MTSRAQAADVLIVVDEDEDRVAAFTSGLISAFAERGCDARLDCTPDTDAAVDRILRRHRPYQVVMADLGLGGGPYPARNLLVVDRARAVSSDTVIVALSRGRVDQQARAAGADIVLPHWELLDPHRPGRPGGLVPLIYLLLCERGLSSVGPALEIPEQLGMQLVLRDAGETALRLLMADAFEVHGPQPTSVRLAYVAPGGSGAHVVRAAAGGLDRTLLVKLGTSKSALRAEQDNYAVSAGVYDPSLRHPYLGVYGPHNGWSALAIPNAANVVTLHAWITGDPTADEVHTVMNRLFLRSGLAKGYRDMVASSGDRPIDLLRLAPLRQALVRAAVTELVPALTHPAAAGIADADAVAGVVESYAREARLGTVAAADTPSGQLVCVAHGNLQADNVLVSPRCDVLVIDLAAFGRHHWAKDVARLAVDLALRGLDAGADSFFWHRVAAWHATLTRLGALDPVIGDDRPQNAAVTGALRWITRHSATVMPPLDEPGRVWEWHVALAEQLLHRTYEKELPPAKRAVALVGAYDQILRAAERLTSRERRP